MPRVAQIKFIIVVISCVTNRADTQITLKCEFTFSFPWSVNVPEMLLLLKNAWVDFLNVLDLVSSLHL